ncbi:MAG TPA: hypothetical protein VLD59_12745 [Steroidobacteraceae bacterium]|nr:hypothetical protein [Steroidobacteraceae bacterium]
MNTDLSSEREMESYLKQLRTSLRALPADQVEDIVREIRSHLIDSAGTSAAGDGRQVNEAIARLGDPAALASAYVMDHLALNAQATRSPLLLLRLVSLWATRSFEGIVALVLAVLGYAIALIGLGCALVKPFTPDRIGLWVEHVPPDDYSFQLGRVAMPPSDAHELLGWYIIPLGLIVGALAFTATTRYLLAKVRKYRRTRSGDISGALASSRS